MKHLRQFVKEENIKRSDYLKARAQFFKFSVSIVFLQIPKRANYLF